MTNKKRRIFLSYASEDQVLAHEVALALSGSDYDVFFDKKDLPFAGDYHSRLRAAVDHADVFVFLVSSDSITPRKYSLTELKYARQRWGHPKGRVLPVIVRPVALNALPAYLRAVTLLEPEGNIAAEVVEAVSTLLPQPGRAPRRREVTKSDPTPFLRYLDREVGILSALLVVSLLLAAAGALINHAYHEVWRMGWMQVLAGTAMAVLAAACFYGQSSHLLWIYGQIQLAYTRSDATAEELNEWLLATNGRDAWVSYRAGLVTIAAAVAAYGYAILTPAMSAVAALLWWTLWVPLGLILVGTVVHWYVSTRFPYAEKPVREWLEELVATIQTLFRHSSR